MATTIEIVNAALTLLGESRIASLDDATKPAREAKAVIDITRDSLIAAHNWSFAKTRAQLPALVSAPAFGYGYAYQLPADCLRLLAVGDYYVGLDLTDYRGAPTELFTIEGRQILTDLGAPLNVRYIKRVEDASQYSAGFAAAFASKLAEVLAEPLTQSDTKRARAEVAHKRDISMAVRAGAIELPPQKLADDEWILSRR